MSTDYCTVYSRLITGVNADADVPARPLANFAVLFIELSRQDWPTKMSRFCVISMAFVVAVAFMAEPLRFLAEVVIDMIRCEA